MFDIIDFTEKDSSKCQLISDHVIRTLLVLPLLPSAKACENNLILFS